MLVNVPLSLNFGFNGCFLIHEKLNMILICYTGINKTDITSFESYTVYSQSKVKTASRFYIMKCSQLINKEFIQPIKSLIERFISIAIIFCWLIAWWLESPKGEWHRCWACLPFRWIHLLIFPGNWNAKYILFHTTLTLVASKSSYDLVYDFFECFGVLTSILIVIFIFPGFLWMATC